MIGVRVYQREDFTEATRLVHSGHVPAERLISRIMPMHQAAAAFLALEAGGDVKVLIDCHNEGTTT